jgi:NADH-quinone oxidoreductase subunit C
MKTSVERLTGLFIELIGPEAMKPKPVAPAPAAAPESSAVLRPATPATPAATPAPTPAKPAAPAAPVAPPPPVQAVAHAAKGFDFEATVAPAQVVAAAQIMDREGFALDAVTGVDWIAQNEMEIVYDFFHPTEPLRTVVRTRVPRAEPELPTISPVFPGANWHERETHDFFGIRFAGHPNLKPFLLPEDADFHPLRKDYQP